MIRFYTFQLKWWNDWSEKYCISQGIVAATSYEEAMTKIVKRFTCIETLTITEATEDADFIFLDEPTYCQVMSNFDAWCQEEDEEDDF